MLVKLIGSLGFRRHYSRPSFARTTKQPGFYEIKRKDGSVAGVKYCACTELAPGIHISFITASEHGSARVETTERITIQTNSA